MGRCKVKWFIILRIKAPYLIGLARSSNNQTKKPFDFDIILKNKGIPYWKPLFYASLKKTSLGNPNLR
jgi:hypothetical protein